MTYADDIVTLISTGGSWSSPAKPSPIYAVYDSPSSIQNYINKHISAVEVRHGQPEFIPENDIYENVIIEVPCVLAGVNQDNLESVFDKIVGIINKYSNDPTALNSTTYSWAHILTPENTSALRGKFWAMNFIVTIGKLANAKTIEA